MLSIAECRKILDDVGQEMTDEEIENFRDHLYVLIRRILRGHIKII